MFAFNLLLFLITLCLVVALHLCMKWIPIKKNSSRHRFSKNLSPNILFLMHIIHSQLHPYHSRQKGSKHPLKILHLYRVINPPSLKSIPHVKIFFIPKATVITNVCYVGLCLSSLLSEVWNMKLNEICSKLKIKTPERHHWRRSDFLLFTSNIFHTFF